MILDLESSLNISPFDFFGQNAFNFFSHPHLQSKHILLITVLEYNNRTFNFATFIYTQHMTQIKKKNRNTRTSKGERGKVRRVDTSSWRGRQWDRQMGKKDRQTRTERQASRLTDQQKQSVMQTAGGKKTDRYAQRDKLAD